MPSSPSKSKAVTTLPASRKARECSPLELRLFTFQHNEAARAFYETNGFSAVAFGVSAYPELEPDVEYRWVA